MTVVHIEFWWRNVRKRLHLEQICADGRILKCIFKK